jgi:hypothetical protein
MISMSNELAGRKHAIAASGHKWVSLGVGFLFDRLVSTLEVLFDQKLYAGLRAGLDANPVALDPLRHLVERNPHPDCASEQPFIS